MVDGLETLRTGIEDTEEEMRHIEELMQGLERQLITFGNLRDGLKDALSLAELGAETVSIQTAQSIGQILGPNVFDQEA